MARDRWMSQRFIRESRLPIHCAPYGMEVEKGIEEATDQPLTTMDYLGVCVKTGFSHVKTLPDVVKEHGRRLMNKQEMSFHQ